MLLFLLATLIRGAVLFVSLDSFNDDPDEYLRLSQNWYSYGIFGDQKTPTAFRPPLYPAILSTLVPLQVRAERPKVIIPRESCNKKVKTKRLVQHLPKESSFQNSFFDRNFALSRNASIALLHWILGVSTIILVWFYARRVGLSSNQAMLAGILVLFDPILLQQSRIVMTETLAAFFSILLLLTTVELVKRRASQWSFLLYALTGVLYGLSTLCRPAFFVFTGLVFLNFIIIEGIFWDCYSKKKHIRIGAINNPQPSLSRNAWLSFGSSSLRIISFLVGFALIIMPWGIRNQKAFDVPIFTTTHGGYTLYLANNPDLYAHYSATTPMTLWDPTTFHSNRTANYEKALQQSGIPPKTTNEELFQNRWAHKEAINTIRSHYPTFLYSCVMRILELWRVIPNRTGVFQHNESIRYEKKLFGIPENTLKNSLRYAIGAFYVIEFSLALLCCIGFVFLRTHNKTPIQSHSFFVSPLIWGALLVVSVQIPHLLYWTNMRMRAPLEVFIPILTILFFTSFPRKTTK